ncbi:MAG: discoidin domain-containing protein, partial [Treponema sp.]|nr:discoidin domain-containing protein [Treponema sp.]
EASFSEEFIEIHEGLEAEVQAVVQAAQADAQETVLADITWTEVRPAANVEACCWAHGTAASLAPDDEGGANSWSDNCPPSAAVDGSTSTWWNTNYSRTVYKHSNKNSSDGGSHWITLDLEDIYNINGFAYQGRQNQNNSRINRYQIYVSEIEDLGRDPADKDTGDHPGHRPPPGKLVHEGNFTDGTAMQRVTFSMPAYGRYVQLRPLSYYGNGGEGAAELRVTRESTKSGFNLIDTVNGIIAEALTENNYNTLTIDESYLAASYQEGIRILGNTKNNPVQYSRLNTLLHGSLNADGSVAVKGAQQYLNDDPDRPPEVLATESDVTAFFKYQNEVDAITRQIRLFLSALQGPSNS